MLEAHARSSVDEVRLREGRRVLRQRTQNPSPVVRDEAGVFVPPAPVVVLASDALRALHAPFVDTAAVAEHAPGR